MSPGDSHSRLAVTQFDSTVNLLSSQLHYNSVQLLSIDGRHEQRSSGNWLFIGECERERETVNCVAVLQSAAQIASALFRNVGIPNIDLY